MDEGGPTVVGDTARHAELHARLQAARAAAAQSLSVLESVSRNSPTASPEPQTQAHAASPSLGAAQWSSNRGGAQEIGNAGVTAPQARSSEALGALATGILRPRGAPPLYRGAAANESTGGGSEGGGGAQLMSFKRLEQQRGAGGGELSGRDTPTGSTTALALPRVRVSGSAARAAVEGGDDAQPGSAGSDASAAGGAWQPPAGDNGGQVAMAPRFNAPGAGAPMAHMQAAHMQCASLRPPDGIHAPTQTLDSRRAAVAAAAAAADAQAASAAARECAGRAAALDKEWGAQRAALEYAVSSRDATIEGLQRQLEDITRKVANDLVATSARLTEKERLRAALASQLAAAQARETRMRGQMEDAIRAAQDESQVAAWQARCIAAEAQVQQLQQSSAAASEAAEQRCGLLRAAVAAATEQCAAVEAAASEQQSRDVAELGNLRAQCEELQRNATAQAAAVEQRLSGDVLRLREQVAAGEHALSIAHRDAAAKERAHAAALADHSSRGAAAVRRVALMETALHEAGERLAHADAQWAAQKRQFLNDVASERRTLDAELAAAREAVDIARQEAARADAARVALEARAVADAEASRTALNEAHSRADALAAELMHVKEAAAYAASESAAKLAAAAAALAAAEGAAQSAASERSRLAAEANDARSAVQNAGTSDRLAVAAARGALTAALERAQKAELQLADAVAAAAAERLRATKRLEAKEAERAQLAALLAEALDCARASAGGRHSSANGQASAASYQPAPSVVTQPLALGGEYSGHDDGSDDVQSSMLPDSPIADVAAQRAAAKAAAEARARAAAAAAALRSAAAREAVAARAAAMIDA